ncbi:MAG: hypothetical protein IH898_05055, partial [Planctomycetes bacterium]|nr:hypothetical protein [Planctomycetota bacterium]
AFWQDDVGYTKLRETLGDQMLTGQGVFISQVEAEQFGTNGRYFPDPNSNQFNASLDPFGVEPTFVNGSAGAHPNPTFSTHATNSVASFYYSDDNGVAPGANTIVIYEANDYLRTFLNCGPSGCGNTAPDAPTFTDPNDGQQKSYVVQNHSWAGTFSGSSSNDQKALRKVDYFVDQYELTTVVGVENGSLDDPHPTLDNLLGYSYNAIVVGRSSGLHAIGPTSSLYGPGRTRPTIVSSRDFTVSAATAIVSGAATLMHEELAGTDGALSEPMRAILLAGATKDEFIDFVDPGTGLLDPWDRTTSQPLDNILGAGRLNVFNSYLITQGGQFDGSSSEASPTPVESYGWDYEEELTSVTNRYYEIVIPDGSIALDFSVILTWNVDINPSFNTEDLTDLSLTLTNVTDPNSPVVEDQSDSEVDNVEHIYIGEGQAVEYLTPGIYTLEVSSGDITQDYGIAWRTSTLFGDDPNNLTPSADFDEDGDVDGSDFLTWQLGLGTLLGASHGDGDADGDGDVDDNDLAIFEANYGSSALVASVVGVPEPGAMAMAAIVVLMCLLSHRQKVMRRAI